MEKTYRNCKSKNFVSVIIKIFIGNFLLALGVSQFIVPGNILTGGVAGISILFSKYLNLPTITMINIMVLMLFFFGALVLGKDFALKTVISSIAYPVFVSILSGINSNGILNNNVINSILGGIFIGIGIGLVLSVDGSTGGMDTLALIVSKHTFTDVALWVFIIDSLTVTSGIITRGVPDAIVGSLSVITSSTMIKLLQRNS